MALRPRLLTSPDEAALLATLNSLTRAGQGARAMALIDDLPLDGASAVSLPVRRAACATGYQFLQGDRPELSAFRILPCVAATLRLRGTNIDARQGGWYAGMALLLRPAGDAAERLGLIDRGSEEPGALPRQHQTRAVPWGDRRGAPHGRTGLSGERGDGGGAWEFCWSLTGLAPTLSGDAWLRLSQLQETVRNAGFRVPEESLARAMALLPTTAWDHVEHWKEPRPPVARAESRSVRTMRQAIQSGAANLRDHGPAGRFLLAETLLEEDNVPVALGVTRRLRQDYPGLVPALDLELECLFAAGMRRQAANVLLERLGLTGPDPRFRAFVDRFGVWSLTDDQYARLVDRDPSERGALTVAARALEEGASSRGTPLALGTVRRPEHDAPSTTCCAPTLWSSWAARCLPREPRPWP